MNCERHYGTISIGVRTPIIREGDDLVQIVSDSVVSAVSDLGMSLKDRDVIAITESIVARSQGNYATVDDIAKDVREKFGENASVGVIFPIMSRNRFAICLKGIARGARKVVLQFNFPSDEVGNKIVSDEDWKKAEGLYSANYENDYMEWTWNQMFPNSVHMFTGVDYLKYYREIVECEGAECEIILSNHYNALLDLLDSNGDRYKVNGIINCDIHTRQSTRKSLREYADEKYNITHNSQYANFPIYSLDCILNTENENRGYSTYGLLGSNKATEEKIKLFPRILESRKLVYDIQKNIFDRFGVNVEVMLYGDGAFKDPVGKIWELADPVVSPAYTDGLVGTPNELKLKYLADNDFADLSGSELKEAIQNRIIQKEDNLVGKMSTEGTTPRQITDLLGSLSDLTSGSGDKGTPVVLIKGYFDNYTND